MNGASCSRFVQGVHENMRPLTQIINMSAAICFAALGAIPLKRPDSLCSDRPYAHLRPHKVPSALLLMGYTYTTFPVKQLCVFGIMEVSTQYLGRELSTCTG